MLCRERRRNNKLRVLSAHVCRTPGHRCTCPAAEHRRLKALLTHTPKNLLEGVHIARHASTSQTLAGAVSDPCCFTSSN
jgi:hypothetical protein